MIWRRRPGLAAAALGALAGLGALAAPTDAGPVRVRLWNGTTSAPGTADLLTLYRLSDGMEPVAQVETPGAETVLEAPEDGAGPAMAPWLVQATWRGVNYNQPVRLGPDGGADVTIEVYEPFETWDERIGLTTWRALYRRIPADIAAGDRLRVDQIFVVANRSDPPRTFVADAGTLRFRLPPEDLMIGFPTVSATGTSGMPTPQSPFPVADAPGGINDHAVRTPFKPGETEVVLSYEVRYPEEFHEARLVAPRASPEMLLLASPSDIALSLPGDATGAEAAAWEILEPDGDADLAVARRRDLDEGETVRLVLSGGSLPAPARGTAGRGTDGAPPALPPLNPSGAAAGPAAGAIGDLPDPTLPGKWAVALLMAAALGFGLLHRAIGGGQAKDT